MEGSFVHVGYSQDLVELFCEIVDHLVSGIGECPLALGSQYLLNMVVSPGRNKDIWVTLKPSVLENNQQLAYVFFKGEKSAVSVFDSPFLGFIDIFFVSNCLAASNKNFEKLIEQEIPAEFKFETDGYTIILPIKFKGEECLFMFDTGASYTGFEISRAYFPQRPSIFSWSSVFVSSYSYI